MDDNVYYLFFLGRFEFELFTALWNASQIVKISSLSHVLLVIRLKNCDTGKWALLYVCTMRRIFSIFFSCVELMVRVSIMSCSTTDTGRTTIKFSISIFFFLQISGAVCRITKYITFNVWIFHRRMDGDRPAAQFHTNWLHRIARITHDNESAVLHTTQCVYTVFVSATSSYTACCARRTCFVCVYGVACDGNSVFSKNR